MSEPTGAVQLLDADLPEGWAWAPLGELCTVRRGASPRPAGDPRYFGGAIPWFKIGDATSAPGRIIEFTEDTVNELGASFSVHIPEGSLIVANSGVSLGFPRITGVPGCIHDGWLYLRDFRGVSRDYLYYFFLHITEALRTFASGTTQPNLNTDIARRLLVPLPPSSEQNLIVHILSTLDDKIEIDRRLNQSLEELAAAVFRSWFIDFDPTVKKGDGQLPVGVPPDVVDFFPSHFEDSELGPIPQGWRVTRVDEVFEFNPARELARGQVAPYLEMAVLPTAGHSPQGWIRREAGSGMRFVNGDTLMARITPCLENGKTAFVDVLDPGEVGWGSTEYVVIRSRPPLPLVASYLLARNDDFRLFAIQGMTGSRGRQRVGSDLLGSYKLALPREPLLMDAFAKIVDPVFEMARANATESRTLAELRNTLLGPLLSGELTIKSAEKAVGAAL